MHTPRLCIDGRAAKEFPVDGMIAQEVVDQLVASHGEEGGLSCDWVEKKRTVLLTHQGQLFSGQLRRFETVSKIGWTPITSLWERSFVRHANLSAFHRFRPADRLSPQHECQTLTTVLPARGRLKKVRKAVPGARYIVPSAKDADVLEQTCGVKVAQIDQVRPFLRRFCHFTDFKRKDARLVLVTVGPDLATKKRKKALSVIKKLYPNLQAKVVSLRSSKEFVPDEWTKLLSQTAVHLYLTAQPFDWATLALESFYFGIPTIFPEDHGALPEMIGPSILAFHSFLVEQPALPQLEQAAKEARRKLEAQGTFEPLGFAKAFREIYLKLDSSFE